MKPPLIFILVPEMILLLLQNSLSGCARYIGQQGGTSLSINTCGHSQISSDVTELGRVMGGAESKPGEFPWITSIQSNEGSHFCAGFMISSRYLISAAHCFCSKYNTLIKYKDDNSAIVGSIKVAVSLVKLSESGDSTKILQVKNLFMHPDFEVDQLNNDIAILELQNDMEWANGLSPICLPKSKTDDHGSGNVTVAGWGYRQCANSPFLSNELHKITVPLWDGNEQMISCTGEECKKVYHDERYRFERRDFVCAGSDGKDILKGDSGGPLMFQDADERWTVIGIVSSGRFMCMDRVPGVYTKVSSYLPWIKEKIE